MEIDKNFNSLFAKYSPRRKNKPTKIFEGPLKKLHAGLGIDWVEQFCTLTVQSINYSKS